jgi:opacity protein-like surface antigen
MRKSLPLIVVVAVAVAAAVAVALVVVVVVVVVKNPVSHPRSVVALVRDPGSRRSPGWTHTFGIGARFWRVFASDTLLNGCASLVRDNVDGGAVELLPT